MLAVTVPNTNPECLYTHGMTASVCVVFVVQCLAVVVLTLVLFSVHHSRAYTGTHADRAAPLSEKTKRHFLYFLAFSLTSVQFLSSAADF